MKSQRTGEVEAVLPASSPEEAQPCQVPYQPSLGTPDYTCSACHEEGGRFPRDVGERTWGHHLLCYHQGSPLESRDPSIDCIAPLFHNT